MNAVDRLTDAALRDADNATSVLSWLLEQWLGDVDRVHADWCLAGLRHEDPDLFDVLDAIHFEDTGEELLADLPSDSPFSAGRRSDEPGRCDCPGSPSPNDNGPGRTPEAVAEAAATPLPGPAA